jgi:hypothetical protein
MHETRIQFTTAANTAVVTTTVVVVVVVIAATAITVVRIRAMFTDVPAVCAGG